MNENFKEQIEHAKGIAQEKGINWNITLDEAGCALKGQAWDLTEISGSNEGAPKLLRTFSKFSDAEQELEKRGILSPNSLNTRAISVHWQDLLKAFTLNHIVVRNKSVSFAQSAQGAMRFIATVTQKEPWQIDASDIQLACEISDVCQSTPARSINIQALIRNYVDLHHLADACPLSALVKGPRLALNGRAKFAKKSNSLATELRERKDANKLPERKAFWQLINILYTKKPVSTADHLRFAMLKLIVMTGLRVGEVVTIPLDWRRTRSYVDESGTPAGEHGGISEVLLIRHFAEKQKQPHLYEESIFIPPMFKDEVQQVLEDVERLTAPLRKTLKAQYESGRIFPQYDPTQLVDAVEMYVHLTGNPVWIVLPHPPELAECLAAFRENFDVSILQKMEEIQRYSTELAGAVSRYFSPEKRKQGLILRDKHGNLSVGRGVRGKYLLVSDVETFISKFVPTKLSDTRPIKLNNGGQLAPWELLFLLPKRAVGEGRGDSVVDVRKTFSVGIPDASVLITALGENGNRSRYTLFDSYGETEAEKALFLTTHQLRHLQDTELFRVGVADTIISKRHNRQSVAQSYVYDHRSLAETLSAVELPDDWTAALGDSAAATLAKMVEAGKANGPIVREFKRIQLEEGDMEALKFLMAEADGFHATPYGTCLNSFTVDPCPKQLECFNECRHLSATDLPEHQANLVTLHGRLSLALEHAKSKPEGTIGRENQIGHAQKRLTGVEKLLSTAPNERVFPQGKDLSQVNNHESILDGT